MSDYPILVGYDGSECAAIALRWAQVEASRRSAPVRLVYVFEWATAVTPVPVGSAWPDPRIRQAAVDAVDETVAAARTVRPDVPLTGMVIDGLTVSTLRKLSEHARLLVVGSRGLGGFAHLRAGSVATGVAAHARCPVLVVRGCAPATCPVVVGVDESVDADQAIGFAFDHAAASGVGLVAVRAWQPVPVPRPRDRGPVAFDAGALAAAEHLRAERAVRSWQEKYPQVPMTIELRPECAAYGLVTASRRAQLVVIGARGRGGMHGLPLGSTARQLVDHSHCPVAIVRDSVEEP
jgi:nucleotide-binding universal stress UspA family protein